MKFILGSGIAGMIVSFYIKDFMVLTKGKGQDAFFMGPKIIRKNQYTESFIKKLNLSLHGYKVRPHTFKSSYCVNGVLKKTLTADQIVGYIKKTRGDSDRIVDIDRFKTSALNDGLSESEGYYMHEVYNALSSLKDFRIRRLFMDIKHINSKKMLIEGNNPALPNIKLSYNYEYIFNTLPAPLFNYLLNNSTKYNIHDSEIIIYIVKSEELFNSLGDNSFVYYVDKSEPYYRITKIGKNVVSVESRKLFFPNKIFKGRFLIMNTVKIPFGKITKEIKLMDRINIRHIGRYAKNKNSLRIHDIIEMFEKGEIEL